MFFLHEFWLHIFFLFFLFFTILFLVCVCFFFVLETLNYLDVQTSHSVTGDVSSRNDAESTEPQTECAISVGGPSSRSSKPVPANIQQNTHLANLLRQPVHESNKSSPRVFL